MRLDMKKYILLLFLSLSLCNYAAMASPLELAGDGITAGLAEDEFVTVTNATSENIKISYNFKNTKTLRVYNLLGKCVSSVRLTAGSSTVDLPTSLERGTYIYSVEDAGKTFGAKKFIVK